MSRSRRSRLASVLDSFRTPVLMDISVLLKETGFKTSHQGRRHTSMSGFIKEKKLAIDCIYLITIFNHGLMLTALFFAH